MLLFITVPLQASIGKKVWSAVTIMGIHSNE